MTERRTYVIRGLKRGMTYGAVVTENFDRDGKLVSGKAEVVAEDAAKSVSA